MKMLDNLDAMSDPTSAIAAVDLFCGAGGLTRGLLDAGIAVKAGIDLDPSCEYAYRHNNEGAEFVLKSVAEIEKKDVEGYFPENALSLLCGCAPCQTFSTYNRNAAEDDSRWQLLGEFSRLVKEVRPDYVSMENVPGLASHSVFDKFLTVLQEEGYSFSYSTVDCSEYGMPQKRKRLVLLGSLVGNIDLLSPEQITLQNAAKTVKGAIGHLSHREAIGASGSDNLHKAQKLSSLNLKRIRASKPNGTWKDWDESLRCECHKKSTGVTYSSVYGRMAWDEPSPTITTQFYNYGSGRFGHPENDRALTLREGALLQTFNEDYAFEDPQNMLSIRDLGRLIGNAVPPMLGYIIGESIRRHAHEQQKARER